MSSYHLQLKIEISRFVLNLAGTSGDDSLARLGTTSFPAFLILSPPGGGKLRDPGNEVDWGMGHFQLARIFFESTASAEFFWDIYPA